MRKNIEISDEKINEFLEQFYSYFESGYAFEEFLKVYLEKIGLDEVVVTQRSSDGGIDLEAVRYGVGGFAGADAVDYFVQAKRNKPGTTIPIEKVRALRGVMPSGSKGIFITTASYSKKTEEFVDADPSRPIILIDGRDLKHINRLDMRLQVVCIMINRQLMQYMTVIIMLKIIIKIYWMQIKI